jgi:hypothetical protein
LQLVNLPHPLNPGMVDNLPLGNFTGWQCRVGDERYVAVDGIMT